MAYTHARVRTHTHTHLGFVLKISVNILRSEKGACFIPVRVPSTRCWAPWEYELVGHTGVCAVAAWRALVGVTERSVWSWLPAVKCHHGAGAATGLGSWVIWLPGLLSRRLSCASPRWLICALCRVQGLPAVIGHHGTEECGGGWARDQQPLFLDPSCPSLAACREKRQPEHRKGSSRGAARGDAQAGGLRTGWTSIASQAPEGGRKEHFWACVRSSGHLGFILLSAMDT